MLTNSMAPLSARVINKALSEFQLQITPDQVSSIQRYMVMLLAWNEKVNLTAIRDPLEVLYRHFWESMYAAAAVPLTARALAHRRCCVGLLRLCGSTGYASVSSRVMST